MDYFIIFNAQLYIIENSALKVIELTFCDNSIAGFRKPIHYTSNIDYKENIIHAIQCTASYHTFTQQNSVNSISIIFSYLMLCYGYTHIIKSDAEHKRNSHDMKLNTSYPFMLKSKFSEIQLHLSWLLIFYMITVFINILPNFKIRHKF
ncbi:hypothetical protein T11_361 [Trichinella zimbabwensis]|uniref:Uncharacterized protein n=1 Tax=Trichinella zimbabwensis TaxID=268475 RepID=A0A0V1HWH7_9BILA|nr:hypothetical protein T11_361 [Trichinella zimbabwensis]